MSIALPIPLEALQDCGAILGKRGAGKSSTARVLFEHELDRNHRCCFIDPMGDASGIRLNPDMTPSRFQNVVIFGGPRGDIPITDEDGAKVARIIGGHDLSCIVDLSLMIQAEQLRFMAAFADVLFDTITIPVTLFVDEAHIFAPQERGEASAKLLNRMTRLNTQGRKRGIFLWLLTQRPARINKNILSGTETLIAMKMTMPQDIKPVGDWLDGHDPAQSKEIQKAIPKLNVGEAFVWASGQNFLERIQFPLHSTLDTGRTPKHGETVGGLELPKIELGDLASLFGAMSTGDPRDDEIKELQEKLDYFSGKMTELRGLLDRKDQALENVRKERDTAIETLLSVQDRIGLAIGSPPIAAAPPGTDPDSVLMVLDGADGVVKPLRRDIRVPIDRVRASSRRMRTAVEVEMAQAAVAIVNPPPAQPLPDPAKALEEGAAYLEKRLTNSRMVNSFNQLVPAQRRIVQAIASRKGLPISREVISHIADVSLTSSNMGIKLERLRETGLIAKEGDNFLFIGGAK